jgi:poly(3-hydroxybutyrate) depolymerase
VLRSRWLLIALGLSNLAAATGLSRADAEQAIASLWAQCRQELQAARAAEMGARSISHDGLWLRWEERVFGDEPAAGRSLWLSLHGGGGTTAAVNDSQWRNQIGLYEPAEGIYVAPRAPTDTWDLWHQAHIDPLFDRLIEGYIALRGVNPDRVFLLGYSAGGDGVWQLAPRLADRWAAAAMMAGHPNDASLLPLRNLPFALFVGGEDAAYGRNRVVAARAVELDALRVADPAGYPHLARVYPGAPHWLDRRDAEAIPWLALHTRTPWPRRVVWVQDDVTHTRFYWLAMPSSAARAGMCLVAEARGQSILLAGGMPAVLTLRLSDELLDLDRDIRVLLAGRELFAGRVERRREAIRQSLLERGDPRSVATALLHLTMPPAAGNAAPEP